MTLAMGFQDDSHNFKSHVTEKHVYQGCCRFFFSLGSIETFLIKLNPVQNKAKMFPHSYIFLLNVNEITFPLNVMSQ